MKTKKSYIIVHPEMGVYLGRFLGLCIWSKLDKADQDHATVLPSEEEACMHIASWDDLNVPDEYNLVPVEHRPPHHASKAEIEAAQPGAW